ncbi:MCE family protein [Gordonia effusa]|uniref:MCE family protein n=1 Tax=Gordonia effusa TaxID=263908 RepID=UPI00058DBDA6|nr:MlaD family protein [Gordonia effusa]
MLTRLVKIQLIVFVIVGIVTLVYVAGKYAKVDRLTGFSEYTVTAQLPESSGGIFTNAEVTYQGVPVGRVSKLELTKSGVNVVMRLNKRGPDVPASAVAVISNRSAIGEQFVDLQPTSATGPYLYDGSVITKSSIPPPLEDVVNSALDFAESVPVEDLHTVIVELGKAFNGQGENLTRLVTSLGNLSKAGVESLPQTISLIQNSNVVLATQSEQSDQILSWARNLDLVTATLAAADPDVRRLLTTGTATSTQLSNLLQKQGADITKVVHDLGSTFKTIEPAGWSTNAAVAMLSALSAGSHSPARGDGQIHFGIVLETNNPAACTQGYESTQALIAKMKAKNPNFDINNDDFPFNTKAECTVPQGSPTGVRSARRAALANPDYPQPWDNKPKKDPDKLNLNPLATQLAFLLGVHAK